MIKIVKKFAQCGIIAVISTAMVCGAESSEPKHRIEGSFSKMINATWVNDVFGYNKFLSYEMNSRSFTRVEGSLTNKRLGLTAGVNANLDDNEIGRLERFTGFLGIKKVYLRIGRGSIKGKTKWTGSLAPGQNGDIEFETSFANVDLIYRKHSWYLGIGYTRFGLPIEVPTLYTEQGKAQQKFGVYVFDPDYNVKVYSFLFGLDTLSSGIHKVKLAGHDFSGLGVFMLAEDRVGLGKSTISNEAVEAAKFLNPGLTPVTDTFFTALVENNTAMGIQWVRHFPRASIGIAWGYEVDFITVTTFNGAASQPGELGFDPSGSFFRHGPVLRAQVAW